MLKALLVSMLLLSSFAYADSKVSLMGSLLFNSPELDTDGADEESALGLGLGVRALMGIQDQLHFRSGAGLVQKNFSVENGAGKDFDYSFVYLNIPLTLYWKASPQVGFFGGTALNAKLSDDCDGATDCDLDDTSSIVLPLILGFDFNFNEKLGMEISYEHGLTEVAEDAKIHSAIVSFLYHF